MYAEDPIEQKEVPPIFYKENNEPVVPLSQTESGHLDLGFLGMGRAWVILAQ